MAEFTELVQALTWLLTNRIQQKIDYIHGLLGDGNGRVRVSTIPGSPEVDYVFVRPDRFSNRTFKAFNKRIEGQDGDPIIIGELPWEPGLVQVVDMDWAAYADVGWGDDVTTTNRHGTAHQWRDGAPGIDTFNVYRRQFGDLKTYATVSGTLDVGVSPYSLDLFGKQYQWPGIQDFSLAGALPATTGTARMNLVYWSPASGTTQGHLGVATGTLGGDSEATILNRPVSPQGVIPSAFVRLAGGQSSITEFDIWDAREPFRPGLEFGTGTAGLSADMIPISDVIGFYTGSTVESALAEVPYKLISPDGGINPVLSVDNNGDIGAGVTPSSVAKMRILDASGPQLRLEFDATHFADFEVDTNHDLTIQPSSTGRVIVRPTSDSLDFFTVTDDAGASVVEVNTISGTPGQLLGPKGTEALPGFSFVGDPATGFQWINASSFGFSGAGTRLIVFKRISTNAAQNNVKQHSTGTTADTFPAHSFLGDEDTGLYRHNVNRCGLTTGGAAALYVHDDQNVKIGDILPTTSVNSRLHVADTDAVTAAITDIVTIGHNSSGTPAVNFGAGLIYQLENDAVADQDAARIAALWIDPANGSEESVLTFETLTGGGSLTEQMRIEGNGNVGIGTPSPDTRLDIDAGALEFAEMTAPAAGAANTTRTYAEDNAGTTRQRVKFSSGNAVTIAEDGGLQTYSITSVVTDRTYAATGTSVTELADVLGTLIADFQAAGILG